MWNACMFLRRIEISKLLWKRDKEKKFNVVMHMWRMTLILGKLAVLEYVNHEQTRRIKREWNGFLVWQFLDFCYFRPPFYKIYGNATFYVWYSNSMGLVSHLTLRKKPAVASNLCRKIFMAQKNSIATHFGTVWVCDAFVF